MKDSDNRFIDNTRYPSDPVAGPKLQEHVRWLLDTLRDMPGTVQDTPFERFGYKVAPQNPSSEVLRTLETVLGCTINDDYSTSYMERLRGNLVADPQTCGERLTFARMAHRWEQAEVLARVKRRDPTFRSQKLTNATLSHFENDRRRPDARMLAALLEALEVGADAATAIIEAAAATPTSGDDTNREYAAWTFVKRKMNVPNASFYEMWREWALSRP